MFNVDVPGMSGDQVETNIRRFEEFAERFQADAAFRGQVEADAAKILPEYGFLIPPGMAVKVVTDSPSVRHLVLPSDPNVDLADESLDAVAGGALSSASTAGSASTALSSTMLSTAGTAGCASTLTGG